MKIAILILAAGRSKRMGVLKQLLPVKDTTLLGMTLSHALKSNADVVYCVLGASIKEIKPTLNHFEIEIIENKYFKDGLSSSIVAGINHISKYSFDSVLVMLGDQPQIDSEFINQLIEMSKIHPEVIIASDYNNNYGVPAIFPHKSFNLLLKLKGDKGAKVLLNSGLHKITGIKNKPLFDIDTKEDYENYLKLL